MNILTLAVFTFKGRETLFHVGFFFVRFCFFMLHNIEPFSDIWHCL